MAPSALLSACMADNGSAKADAGMDTTARTARRAVVKRVFRMSNPQREDDSLRV